MWSNYEINEYRYSPLQVEPSSQREPEFFIEDKMYVFIICFYELEIVHALLKQIYA